MKLLVIYFAVLSLLIVSIKAGGEICEDLFGTRIALVPDDGYIFLDLDGNPASGKMTCDDDDDGEATTVTFFNLSTCRCSNDRSTIRRQNRTAVFWANFDNNKDYKDYSVNKLATYPSFDGVKHDYTTWAHGGASLRLNNGFLSIPGLKSVDFRNQASFCAFFKCDGNTGCSKKGGILSNYKDDNDHTVVISVEPGNVVTGQLNFRNQIGTQKVSAKFDSPPNGWNHVCLTYDGTMIRLHLNGQLAGLRYQDGSPIFSLGTLPYLVGSDAKLGFFNGNIDDVLITPFAMTVDEIRAHYDGNRHILRQHGFGTGFDHIVNTFYLTLLISPKFSGKTEQQGDHDQNTALHEAAAVDAIKTVKRLWSKMRQQIDVENGDKNTPLHVAIQNEALRVADFLLQQKPSLVHLKESTYGFTPLHMAAARGNIKIVKLFVDKYHADVTAVDHRTKSTPIHLAALFGHVPIVEFLLGKKSTLLEVGQLTGDRLIHVATLSNQIGVVDYLLSRRGVDVDVRQTSYGRSPLHIASDGGHFELSKLLVERYRANAYLQSNLKEDDESLPIHLAASQGRLGVAKYLVGKFPDLVNVKDGAGRTPLQRAVESGSYNDANQVAELLSKFPAKKKLLLF